MVAAGQAQNLGQHAEVDTVVRIAVEHGVHRAVDVQQHAVVAAPVGQARVGVRTAGEVVVHDDRRADFLRVFGTLVHFFRSRCGHVQVVALAFAGFAFRLQSIASCTKSKRARQRMNGWLLTFSSSLVKSRPPRRHS